MVRHALRIEVQEGVAVALALAQDRDPGEAGLRALEAQQLEEGALVVQRDAPLLVVVGGVERIAAGGPPAADGLARRGIHAGRSISLRDFACHGSRHEAGEPAVRRRGDRRRLARARASRWTTAGASAGSG